MNLEICPKEQKKKKRKEKKQYNHNILSTVIFKVDYIRHKWFLVASCKLLCGGSGFSCRTRAAERS